MRDERTNGCRRVAASRSTASWRFASRSPRFDAQSEERPLAHGQPPAVAAAATPSMPIELAAFGLCTTAVDRGRRGPSRHGLGDGGGERLQQVEGRRPTVSRASCAMAPVVGGRRRSRRRRPGPRGRGPRRTAAARPSRRVGAVTALAPDPAEEQPARASFVVPSSHRRLLRRGRPAGRRSSWIITAPVGSRRARAAHAGTAHAGTRRSSARSCRSRPPARSDGSRAGAPSVEVGIHSFSRSAASIGM